ITTTLSLFIVHEAYQLGAPGHVIARMLGNVALDGVFGAVPLVGDAFDVLWRANRRNVRLLREWLEHERRANVVLSNRPEIDLSLPVPQPRCGSGGVGGLHMVLEAKIRRFSGAVFGTRIAISALAVGAFIPTSAAAQTGEPLKIGYSMALTGGLGSNGRSALLAQKIWEEDTNAKGGLLGRPVKLIYYDDQTNPATVPGIYAKLLDVDKVELIIGPYGTNLQAPAMPIAMQ